MRAIHAVKGAALLPDATVDDVLATIREYLVDLVYRAIDLTFDFVDKSASIDEFVVSFYDEMLGWAWPAVEWDKERFYEGEIYSGSSLEIVPGVMALLSLTDGDVEGAIVARASLGRDRDTIGHLAGNISDALAGTDTIRDYWVEHVERANRDFFAKVHDDPDEGFAAMAGRLVDAFENEHERADDRRRQLDAMLG